MFVFRRKIKKSHFTIVEFLLVIEIIEILTTMLLPALRRVREMAKRTACQGNLKQIGHATQMYPNGDYFHKARQWKDLFTIYGLDYVRSDPGSWDQATTDKYIYKAHDWLGVNALFYDGHITFIRKDPRKIVYSGGAGTNYPVKGFWVWLSNNNFNYQ